VAGVRELPGLFPRNALKMIFFPDGSAFPFSDERKPSRWPTMATKRHAASYSKKKTGNDASDIGRLHHCS
jgi:hypothetical protein